MYSTIKVNLFTHDLEFHLDFFYLKNLILQNLFVQFEFEKLQFL